MGRPRKIRGGEEAWCREEGLLAPRTHTQLRGWLQVNWSQPPMLLNSHGAPQPWCPRKQGGEQGGWRGMSCPAATGLRLCRGRRQRRRAPAPVEPRGSRSSVGGASGHCPVPWLPAGAGVTSAGCPQASPQLTSWGSEARGHLPGAGLGKDTLPPLWASPPSESPGDTLPWVLRCVGISAC